MTAAAGPPGLVLEIAAYDAPAASASSKPFLPVTSGDVVVHPAS